MITRRAPKPRRMTMSMLLAHHRLIVAEQIAEQIQASVRNRWDSDDLDGMARERQAEEDVATVLRVGKWKD